MLVAVVLTAAATSVAFAQPVPGPIVQTAQPGLEDRQTAPTRSGTYDPRDVLTPAPPERDDVGTAPTETDPRNGVPGDAATGLGRQYGAPAGDALTKPAGSESLSVGGEGGEP